MAAERKRIFAEEREEEAAREAERMALELERRAEAEGDGDGWRYVSCSLLCRSSVWYIFRREERLMSFK